MRAAFLVGAFTFVVACNPASPGVDMCADERAEFDAVIASLEAAVDEFDPKLIAMTERVDGGENVPDADIKEFEAAQSELEKTLFDGQKKGDALMARIATGCKD